ncbi:MAG: hypothetical protein ABW352_10025 [Polyangiales bacterium]
MNKLLSAAFVLCSCTESVDQLLPQIRSELTPGTELRYVHAEILDERGEYAVYHRWLRVGTDCTLGPDGRYVLGSFSVEKGDLAVSRIRLTAYGEEDGKAVPLIEQRADAVFQRGTLSVPFSFGRQCMAQNHCVGTTTCDPNTGGCIGVPNFQTPADVERVQTGEHCLTELDMPPALGPAKVAAAPVLCVPGDDVCPPGCDGTRDADCRPSLGEACGNGQQACTAGTQCVHGVCCEQACTGTCERCDLPDQKGYCRPITYSQSLAPLSSPDHTVQCADHVDYTCTRGSCTSACAPTHFNCDGDLQGKGCETEAGTPHNCQRCGDACPYGYCGPEGCGWSTSTRIEPVTSAPVEAGTLYASTIAFAPNDKKLRALGALVHPGASGSLRIAIYYKRGTSFDLFAFTNVLSIVDNTHSQVAVGADVVRVESKIESKDIPLDAVFQIAFQVTDPTQLYARDMQKSWSTEPVAFGPFPSQLTPQPAVTKLHAFQVYAITTAN